MFYHSNRYWYYPLISFSVALGISIGTPQTAVAVPWFELFIRGTQIVQLYNISDEEEVSLGRQINNQLIGREFQLDRNASVNRYVNRIGQRLAKNSTRPNIPYTFQVVRDYPSGSGKADRNVNAFATMGGFVYVTTGLLNTVDNEAQLAAVAQGVATAAGVDSSTLVQLGVEFALNRPRSRDDEYEADRLGIQTLAKADYPPIALVQFLEKLRNQPSPPAFLSTHPATGDRIARLREMINAQQANR